MRILLAAPAHGVSGGICSWTKHVIAYYESLRVKPVQLDVYDIARSKFIPDNVSLVPRLFLAFRDYGAIIKGYKLQLLSNKYDIVHITSSAGLGLIRDLLMIRLAHRNDSKIIVHFRFGRIPQLIENNNWEWKLLSWVIIKSDRVIVLDEQSFISLTKKGYANISLIPNPLAPRVLNLINGFSQVRRESRTILFIGHCIATKGVFELVKACNNIKDIRLRLIGAIQNDVREQLLSISSNNNWLEILGEQPYEEVIRQLLTCDVFVLPTYSEGFPNVLLEAMACGCSIITTPVGAIPEILRSDNGNEYGIIVPIKDSTALQLAILKMLNDTTYKEACGSNAKRRVSEKYSMDNIWSQMLDIWNNL